MNNNRNWDDDEAERKLIILSKEYEDLRHENKLLEIALSLVNKNRDYYCWDPCGENHLETLCENVQIRITSTWLKELIKQEVAK